MNIITGLWIILSGVFLVAFNLWAILAFADKFGAGAALIAALLLTTAAASLVRSLDTNRR